MTLYSNFKIKNLTAQDFKDAEIIDASEGRICGRRFKLKIGTLTSKEYRLCDIYKKVHELSSQKIQSKQKIANLSSLKIFLGKLKIAHTLTENAFSEREYDWYKILTLFLRLFNSGSHTVKMDGIADEILSNLTKTNLNIEDKCGNTPLAIAAHQGDILLMKCLINAGADVNYPNSSGDTPLFYASRKNDLEAVKVLLELDADCNIVNNSGETALICAASRGHTEIVEWLLQNKNIEINLQDNSGKTALIYGTSHYFESILELLIKNENIDVNLRDKAGKTAFQYAVSYQNAYFAGLLLEHKDIEINCQDKDGKTALMQATSGQMREIARTLLEHKNIEINLQDKDGKTALMYGILDCGRTFVSLLLEHQDIKINMQDKEGRSALMYALSNRDAAILWYTFNRDEKVVKLLLEHQDIEINMHDKDGKTALMYATSNSDKKLVKLLLEHEKIDVNHQDACGFTAFMIANSLGYKNIVKVLTKYLTQNDLFCQKEILKLKLLAHSNQLGGTGEINAIGQEANYNVLLEGSIFSYVLKKMKKVTERFPCATFSSIESGEVLQLTNFISTGFESSNNSLKLIKKGFPVFLHTGFKNHSVAVIIWGSYFVLCNRGEASRKVVEVFKYDPNKMKHRVLDEIKEQKDQDLKSYQYLFFERLPKQIGFQVQGPFELALEELCKKILKNQSVGNCTWASPETAIFVFFALNTILGDNKGLLNLDAIPSSIHDKQVKDINNKFYSWLIFNQSYQLERYLGPHVLRPDDNIQKVERRKINRNSVNIDYPFLIQAVQSILSTAKNASDYDKNFYGKTLNILKIILAKTISLKNSGHEEKHLKTAEAILDSIETIPAYKMKAAFESI